MKFGLLFYLNINRLFGIQSNTRCQYPSIHSVYSFNHFVPQTSFPATVSKTFVNSTKTQYRLFGYVHNFHNYILNKCAITYGEPLFESCLSWIIIKYYLILKTPVFCNMLVKSFPKHLSIVADLCEFGS